MAGDLDTGSTIGVDDRAINSRTCCISDRGGAWCAGRHYFGIFGAEPGHGVHDIDKRESSRACAPDLLPDHRPGAARARPAPGRLRPKTRSTAWPRSPKRGTASRRNWCRGRHSDGEGTRGHVNDLDDSRADWGVRGFQPSQGRTGPSPWLPPSARYACRHATDWVADKTRYRLAVDPAESAALTETLRRCPGAPVTRGSKRAHSACVRSPRPTPRATSQRSGRHMIRRTGPGASRLEQVSSISISRRRST